MKIIYYITDHGLGHASRSVALIRELKNHADLVVRSDDPHNFLVRSLQGIKVVPGATDFAPVMRQNNGMLIDYTKTQASISDWIANLPVIIEKELKIIKNEEPDLIISDISIMPLMAARKVNIRSAAVSNFTWNETLELNEKTCRFLQSAYSQADIVIRLPFGTEMKYPNRISAGLVARKTTVERSEIRKEIGINDRMKLVIVAVSGANKLRLNVSKDIHMLDISDYHTVMKLKEMMNFVEGQNLVGASDLVICKCGYGFVSECLSTGTRFRYVVDTDHREANEIHRHLESKRLNNRIEICDLERMRLDSRFIDESHSMKMNLDNENVSRKLLEVASGS